MNLKCKKVKGHDVHYLFETHRDSIKTYYQMKEKNGYSFTDPEKEALKQKVLPLFHRFLEDKQDAVLIIPDTQNVFFKSVVLALNRPFYVVKKKTKEEVLKALESEFMMKAERKKLTDTLMAMKDIKIGGIAANQRQRVSRLLFEDPEGLNDKKIVYLDDSLFTGSTFKALAEKYPIHHTLVMFSDAD